MSYLSQSGWKSSTVFDKRLPFMFYLGFELLGLGPLILGNTIHFTWFTDSDVNLIQKHAQGHTQINIPPNTWVPHGTVNLTHKIKQYSSSSKLIHVAVAKRICQKRWG